MPFSKNYTLELLELLTKLDFFFIKSKNSLKNRVDNYIKIKKISNKKNHNLIVLEPVSFLKDLKRVIRLLQFINKSQNISGLFSVKNEYLFDYLNFLFKKHLKNQRKLFLKKNTRVNSLKSSTATFFFDYPVNTMSYSKLFLTKKYLFSEFNSNKNFNDLGIYKLFTNFNNPKKLIFFILLLKALQNKTYENKK